MEPQIINRVVNPSTKKNIANLKQQFDQIGYIKLPSFFIPAVFDNIETEVNNLLEAFALRKDFLMEETNNTPRRITTVSGKVIDQESPFLTDLYKNDEIIDFITKITDNSICLTPDMADRHAIHKLHKKNDIHGGHLDTYPYVLITCFESPGKDGGGELEFVPKSMDLSELGTEKSVIDYLEKGDSYLMNASHSVHRVLPLKEDRNRTVLVLTYADLATKDVDISYSSNKLYD